MLDVGLERVDGPGSPFAYANVDGIVGRRCGKSVTTMGVPLARALAGPVTLDNGRVLPFLGAHTAQNLVKARQRFMKDLVEPFRDSMSLAVWQAGVNLRQGISDTALTIDPAVAGKDWRKRRSSIVQVFAPTRSSVRGDGIMHLTFDEYLVFSALQGQELMAAAGPTLGDARGHGQIWRVSNISMMNGEKTAIWDMKERGRAAVASGRTTGTAYFEFTVPGDVDTDDEETWWEYYPALADNIIRIEELREDRERLGRESFDAEYLGRWPGAGLLIVPWMTIGRTVWENAGVDDELPDAVPAALGVEIDPYDRSSSIVASTTDPQRDGILQEVIDHRPGSTWVPDRMRQLAPTTTVFAIDDYGPGHDLILELEDDPQLQGKIMRLGGTDLVSSCFAWDSRLKAGGLHVRKSDYYAAATTAASAAQRTTGKAWQWERRGPVPQTPVMAATLSAWALGRAPEPEEFFVY